VFNDLSVLVSVRIRTDGGADSTKGMRMSIQRVEQDPIPFLILFGLILLAVWIWRWFKRR
jgi:hypothetical protein